MQQLKFAISINLLMTSLLLLKSCDIHSKVYSISSDIFTLKLRCSKNNT